MDTNQSAALLHAGCEPVKADVVVDQFFDAWKRRDYKSMASCLSVTWQLAHQADQPWWVNMFKRRSLVAYTVGDWILADVNGRPGNPDVIVDVPVDVEYTESTRTYHDTLLVRCIKEAGAYTPSTAGVWGVNPISVMRRSA